MKIKYEQCIYIIALNETGGKTKGQGIQSLATYVRKIVKFKSELETHKVETFLKTEKLKKEDFKKSSYD